MSLEQPKSILKDKPLDKSVDYSFLKKTGIEVIQDLSGKIWTDYNEHDPGVTILENLCFALTELGYKTNFKVKDLFFNQSEDGDKSFLKTFYGPNEILPPAPVTILDFRKTLIDQVNNLQNIWLLPKRQSIIGTRINGLYEVLVMVDPNYKDKESIRLEVEDFLQANRNLGEDFESVKILSFEKVHFKANIGIAPDAIGESVYADILAVIQKSFSPSISLYTVDELLDMGYGYDYIHEHPRVKNGYVLEEELLESELHHVNKIFKSNIIRLISEIDGVHEVYNFSIYVNNELVNTEIIQLEEHKIPLLDADRMIEENCLSLVAGDISYHADKDVVRYTYEVEKSRNAVKHSRYLEEDKEDIISKVEKADLEKYYSIQNSFPRTYGITDFGIQGKVSDQREAQVNQLRAYLFFYEQIMANYLSQLAHVDQLFSTNENMEHTYFYQHLFEINGYKDIIRPEYGSSDLPLDKINKKFDRVKERRNKLLDQMLARFGEEFLMEAYNAIHRESSSVAKSNFLEETIQAKIAFLNNFVDISRNKSKGYNHLLDYTKKENVSGLEKKISLLFNFDYGYKKLSALSENKDITISNKEEKATKTKVSFSSKNPNFIADFMAFGGDRNSYLIEESKGKSTLYFENPIDKERIKIYQADSIKACEDTTTILLEKVKSYNEISDGFHVLEHILLRDINSNFRYIYISEANVELTSPYNYNDSETDRIAFINQLIEVGQAKSNYSVKKDGDYYKLSLSKKGSSFQVISNELIDKHSAEEAISALVEEFKQTKITDEDMELRLHIDQDMSNVSVYDEDPYSLQLSFICPAWNGRFRSDKMKYLFENVVKLNTPAHLKVNFHWLSLEQMKDFELYYEQWLAGKNDRSFSRKKLDSISKVLLLLLNSYGQKEIDKSLKREIKYAKEALE